nr:hypothetical protein [Mucilaginibacter sp. E4BP6]
MKKKKEVSLLGALVICAITLAVYQLLKLNDQKESELKT